MRLDQDLENLAFAVDGAPHINLASSNCDHHFVKMPPRVIFRPDLPQIPWHAWSEFEHPPTDRLIADNQSALSEEILDVPVA
jgi:hypothetical protein